MRLGHFETLQPICPRCRQRQHLSPLSLGPHKTIDRDDIIEGTLLCPSPDCRLEFPIIDGIPIIVPDVQAYVAVSLFEILVRDDLGELAESLLGDAAGPSSLLEATRQRLSIYAWDGYAALDPAESGAEPGAVLRCLEALLRLGGPSGSGPILDLGCAVGASSFDLAARTDGLVLGIDLNFSMLRLARRVLKTGRVSYSRRRIGLVYDRRDFAVEFAGSDRVDFWACDALALPFQPECAETAVALNLFDCVPSPLGLVQEMRRVLRRGGQLLLATPYDWTAGATDPTGWIGGHSQRGGFNGAAEPLLEALLTPGALPQSVAGLRLRAQDLDFPWQTRLHERSTVTYRLHLAAAVVE